MCTVIRRGTEADAPAATATLRRSITELCVADHHGDTDEIAGWLRNKTVESWRIWIAYDDVVVLVAERAKLIAGVGMMNSQGEILLNYVHPEARFSGVSTALLAALEEEARAQGIQACCLESTETGRDFYGRHGYLPYAPDPLRFSKRI